MEQLLQAGADAIFPDASSTTPLHLAIELGRIVLVKLMCESLKSRDLGLIRDSSERSLIWSVLMSSHADDICRVLFAHDVL